MATKKDLSGVIAAAKAGGRVLTRYFGEILQTEEKSNASDLRTKADTESEQAIVAALKKGFPNYNYYAEESGYFDNNSTHTFVIDPLDGTSNFVLGIPNFTISVGLLEDDKPILGVIYNPILDNLCTALRGEGAFMNGERIRVNTEIDSSRSTVSYTCGYNTSEEYSDAVRHSLRKLGIKRTLETWAPAYDYCMLASGRLEAVISKEGDFEDFIAAKVIITEAGGFITAFDGSVAGGRSTDFVASNGTNLHQELLEILP